MKKYSIDKFASDKLAALTKKSLQRQLISTARGKAGTAKRRDQRLISFCCNDYLGLSKHPHVKESAKEALDIFGVGAGASRLVTGNHPLYKVLETRLAQIKCTESATVFGNGYLANLGTIPAYVGVNDICVADKFIHSSMHSGLRASGAKTIFFDHNDLDDCRAILKHSRGKYKHCLILTEGVFSMDGDRAPLSGLCDLAEEFEAWLFVDDAHGFGVLGNGAGSAAEAGVGTRIALQMGTLSKSVGSYGGFICSSRPVSELLINRARCLIYETGLPPATIAASVAALDLIEKNEELVSRPLKLAKRFTDSLGLNPAQSAIVPIIVGTADAALHASKKLEKHGFLVTAIRPPTVPSGTSRLRFTFCADHLNSDLNRLIETVRLLGIAG